MRAHILSSKGMYDLISKGGSHIYIHRKVAPHYNSYKVAHFVNPMNMGPMFKILKVDTKLYFYR